MRLCRRQKFSKITVTVLTQKKKWKLAFFVGFYGRFLRIRIATMTIAMITATAATNGYSMIIDSSPDGSNGAAVGAGVAAASPTAR